MIILFELKKKWLSFAAKSRKNNISRYLIYFDKDSLSPPQESTFNLFWCTGFYCHGDYCLSLPPPSPPGATTMETEIIFRKIKQLRTSFYSSFWNDDESSEGWRIQKDGKAEKETLLFEKKKKVRHWNFFLTTSWLIFCFIWLRKRF